jgi:hypothetical protein
VQQTETGLFPVAGVGVELEHRASDHALLAALGRYQSSMGLGVIELHTDGSEHPVDVRAHRLEAGFAPTFLLDERGGWAIELCAAYSVLGFRPLSHLVTPAFSLSGPLLRAQLQVPIGSVLRIRVGPEAQWIVTAGEDLRERGVSSSGFGVGGEAALELSLGARVQVAAAYREGWSFLASSAPSGDGRGFRDTARFVTARVTGQL